MQKIVNNIWKQKWYFGIPVTGFGKAFVIFEIIMLDLIENKLLTDTSSLSRWIIFLMI